MTTLTANSPTIGGPTNLIERRAVVYVLLPEDVEKTIRAGLEELGRTVTAILPSVTARFFSTHANTLFVNCYLELSFAGREESLIASVNYRNNRGRFVATADVCGEESGGFVWERPEMAVNPNDVEEVGRILNDAVADLVAHSTDSIVAALRSCKN